MKKLLILFAMLFSIAPVFAQADDDDDVVSFRKEKNNALFMGVKVGATFTSMTQPNECDLYDGSAVGLSGGLSMKTRFGKATENSNGGTGVFGLGLDLLYKMNSVKTIGTNEDGDENANLTMSYFEVPVSLQFYPFVKSASMNAIYVEFGASFLGTLSSTPESLTVPTANVSYKTGDLKGFDVRPFLGVGYGVSGLNLNARYYIGTSELAGNFPCKMSCAEISLGLMFNAAKF